MKICIFGARDLDSAEVEDAIIEVLDEKFSTEDNLEIVSGGAPGVDALGEGLARANDYDLTVMYANWDKRGKAAGTHRNNRMADYCDAGIGVPGPNSKGTYHMINALKKRGKPVFVIDRFTK